MEPKKKRGRKPKKNKKIPNKKRGRKPKGGKIIKTHTLSATNEENILETNIISIESVIDSDGNEYHEVPYLAQDTIFEEIENIAANDPELYSYNHQTPYLLKTKN